MSVPKVFVWVKPIRVRGGASSEFAGLAMAADGSILKRVTHRDRSQVKAELVTDPTRDKYAEWYSSSYDVVWLDDHPECDVGWWRAQFADVRKYHFRWSDQNKVAPRFLEVRNDAGSEVLGHIIEQPLFCCWYVSIGALSPRHGDTFPEPGYLCLADAVTAAHNQFNPDL